MEKDDNKKEKMKTGRSMSNTDWFIAVFVVLSIVISIGVSVYASTVHDNKRLLETKAENIDITYSDELAGRIRITPNPDDPDSDDLVICPDLQLKNFKLTEKVNVFDKAHNKLEEVEEIVFSGEVITPAESVVINIAGSSQTEDGEERVLVQIEEGRSQGERQFQLKRSILDEDDVELKRLDSFEVQDIQVVPCPAFIGYSVKSGGLYTEPDTTMPSVLIGANPEYPGMNDNSPLPFVENCRLRSEKLLPDARSFALEYEAGVLPERILAEYDIEMFEKWWTRDWKSASYDFRLYTKGNEVVALEILPGEEDLPGVTRYRVTAAVVDDTQAVQSAPPDSAVSSEGRENGRQNDQDTSITSFCPDLISGVEIRVPQGSILREYSAEEPLFQEFALEVPGEISEPGKAIYYKGKAVSITAEEETGSYTIYKYELCGKPSEDSFAPAAAELLVSKKPVAGTGSYPCQVSIWGYAPAQGTSATGKEKIIKEFGSYKLPGGARIDELSLAGIPVDDEDGVKQNGHQENRLLGVINKESLYPATLNIRVSWDKEGDGAQTGKERRWFQETVHAYPLSVQDMMTREIAFEFELGDDIDNLKVEEVRMIEWPLEFCSLETVTEGPDGGKPDFSPDEEVSSNPTTDMLFRQSLPGNEINNDGPSDSLFLDCEYEAEYSGEALLAFFDQVAFSDGWYRNNNLSKGSKREYEKAGYELTVEILPEKTVVFESLPGSYERTRYRLSIHPG